MNPYKVTDGKWLCWKAKHNNPQLNAMATICKAVCATGKIPKEGVALARCQSFRTKKQQIPGVWYWPNNRVTDQITCQ